MIDSRVAKRSYAKMGRVGRERELNRLCGGIEFTENFTETIRAHDYPADDVS